MKKKKSDRDKLRDSIIKYSNLRNKDYKDKYSLSGYRHPKTGKSVTFSEVSWYFQCELEKILDKFFPDETTKI